MNQNIENGQNQKKKGFFNGLDNLLGGGYMSAFGVGQKNRSATIKEVLNNVGNKTSQGI